MKKEKSKIKATKEAKNEAENVTLLTEEQLSSVAAGMNPNVLTVIGTAIAAGSMLALTDTVPDLGEQNDGK